MLLDFTREWIYLSKTNSEYSIIIGHLIRKTGPDKSHTTLGYVDRQNYV